MEQLLYFSETLYKGIGKTVTDYLEFADKNEELEVALKNINELLAPELPGSRTFKCGISEACRTYIGSKSI